MPALNLSNLKIKLQGRKSKHQKPWHGEEYIQTIDKSTERKQLMLRRLRNSLQTEMIHTIESPKSL